MYVRVSVIFTRVIELMTNPGPTWEVIRDEPDSGRQLVLRYVLMLALIPTICGFLGNLLYSGGLLYALVYSILMMAVFVASVYALGLLVSAMASSFDTEANENAALKCSAYASTPVWVAGFLTVVPQLSLLAMLAGFGYAAYLFKTGCQILMSTPKKKSLRFSAVAIGTWFAMVLIMALVISRIAALLFAPMIVLDRLSQSSNIPTWI